MDKATIKQILDENGIITIKGQTLTRIHNGLYSITFENNGGMAWQSFDEFFEHFEINQEGFSPDVAETYLLALNKDLDKQDYEAAHGTEMSLVLRFIEAMVNGTCSEEHKCAEKVLKALRMEFPRWG